MIGLTKEVENGLSVLPYTVVKIEGTSHNNPKVVHSGTGFFYNVETNQGPIPMVATNKHVIDGFDELRFHMALSDNDGKRLFGKAEIVTLSTAQLPILRHSDPNVDLAMVAAWPILAQLKESGKNPYFMPLSRRSFPPDWLSRKLSAFTNVVMIGFPNGLMDVTNNLPISRRGTLSTHYYADYNGLKNFVIDIAAFGGSSGSPVFAYFDAMAPAEDGFYIGGSQCHFIGVLHSGPTISAQGEVMPAPIPTARQVSTMSLMMHIGYCAKVSLLEDFVPLLEDKLTKSRASTHRS